MSVIQGLEPPTPSWRGVLLNDQGNQLLAQRSGLFPHRRSTKPHNLRLLFANILVHVCDPPEINENWPKRKIRNSFCLTIRGLNVAFPTVLILNISSVIPHHWLMPEPARHAATSFYSFEQT